MMAMSGAVQSVSFPAQRRYTPHLDRPLQLRFLPESDGIATVGQEPASEEKLIYLISSSPPLWRTKIERPLLVGGRVYPQRSAHPHAVFSLLAGAAPSRLRDRCFAIDSVYPLIVHLLAFTAQQHVQTPIAEARLLAPQRDQTLT
jgi:hypothetical protein